MQQPRYSPAPQGAMRPQTRPPVPNVSRLKFIFIFLANSFPANNSRATDSRAQTSRNNIRSGEVVVWLGRLFLFHYERRQD